MAQNDFVIADQTASAALADINSALQSLASCSSGATQPSVRYANQLWYDTSTDTLKIRNEANSAWISMLYVHQADGAVHILDNTYVSTTSGTHVGLLGDQATAEWTAGTGTTESLVSPAKIKSAIQSLVPDTLGEGQTWQAVTRVAGTSYQNTTGRAIQAMVQLGQSASYQFQVSSDNSTWLVMYNGDGGAPIVAAAVIPPSYYYRVTGAFGRWHELR